MTHFLSTSAGLAENVFILASMDGMAPTKPARCALIYPQSPLRSTPTEPYSETISMRCNGGIISPLGRMIGWDRIGRGGMGDDLSLTFRRDGDIGAREPFAELDQAGLGQKILLQRALEKINGEVGGHRHRRPADAGVSRDVGPQIGQCHHGRSRNRPTGTQRLRIKALADTAAAEPDFVDCKAALRIEHLRKFCLEQTLDLRLRQFRLFLHVAAPHLRFGYNARCRFANPR